MSKIINVAKNTNKQREFQTYSAWKSAVKELDPRASFLGNKDIDESFSKGNYLAEWDGDKGIIETFN